MKALNFNFGDYRLAIYNQFRYILLLKKPYELLLTWVWSPTDKFDPTTFLSSVPNEIRNFVKYALTGIGYIGVCKE